MPSTDKPRIAPATIRQQAKQLGLVAKKPRNDRKWYFSDATNQMVSDRNGLNDEQAVAFLEQRGQS